MSADGPPTYVEVVSGDGQMFIEGAIVAGVRDYDGAWDLDGTFTVLTDEGERIRVNGWVCFVDIVPAPTPPPASDPAA